MGNLVTDNINLVTDISDLETIDLLTVECRIETCD